MAEKILLKAKKDAPEVISQGNLRAERKDGHYRVEHRAFADFIIGAGYAEEVEKSSAAPKRKKKSSARRTKPTESPSPAQETAAEKPAVEENQSEGETE